MSPAHRATRDIEAGFPPGAIRATQRPHAHLSLPTLSPHPSPYPWPVWLPHLTVLTRLQATPVHPLFTVGALETRWAMTDIGRVRVFSTNAQAAIEAGSICACHTAHLTSKPVESPRTGTLKGARDFLNRDKLALGRGILGAKSRPFL